MKKETPTALERIRRSRLAGDTRGLSTVEYVILLALVAIIAIGVWKMFGGNVKKGVTDANETFNTNVLNGSGQTSPSP